MKQFIILILSIINLGSCDNKGSEFNQKPNVDLIWKMINTSDEKNAEFTMYFFLSNDSVRIITDMTMLKFPFEFKSDSVIIGDKRFLIKHVENGSIELHQNGILFSSVKEHSLTSVFWDSYNFNHKVFYSNKGEELILEDEILQDPK